MFAIKKSEMTGCTWRYERYREDGLVDCFYVGYDLNPDTKQIVGKVGRGEIEDTVAPFYVVAEYVSEEDGGEKAVLLALYRTREILRRHLEAIEEVVEEWEKKVREEEGDDTEGED